MKRELTKYLNTLDQKELIKEIKKLYDKFEPVQQYYELELSDNSKKVLEEFKEKIKKEYFPKRGFPKARNNVSRKIVNDFKKIAVHKKDIVELWLYRTKMMIEFTQEFGDIDEPFYNSLSSGFEQACKIIRKEQLQPYYRSSCQDLVSQTYNIGWGLSFEMKDIYQRYFVD